MMHLVCSHGAELERSWQQK